MRLFLTKYPTSLLIGLFQNCAPCEQRFVNGNGLRIPMLVPITPLFVSYLLAWSITSGYAALGVGFPYGYILATHENLPGEWLQLACFY